MTEQEFRDRYPRYKRTIFIDEAEEKCLGLYNSYSRTNTTAFTTAVPFVTIGSYDYLRIQLRYVYYSSEKPSWEYSVNAIAGADSKKGFASIQDAFIAALTSAKNTVETLEAGIERELKIWNERKRG